MPPDDTPKIVALLMKWFHLEQRQAEYVLLGFVIVAILVSLFLFLSGGSNEGDLLQQKLYPEGESVLR